MRKEHATMTAQILDGRAMATTIRAELRERATARANELGFAPGLAILRIGDDPASAVYTNQLARAAEQVSVRATVEQLEADTPPARVRDALQQLNDDPRIQGILVQMPLPPQVPQQMIADRIEPDKDVDGISTRSMGNLFLHLPTFVPSTCLAVMEMLARAGVRIAGRRAVVVGKSNVVGKPLAFLLLQYDATISVCHRRTRDLGFYTRQADILVVAAGVPGLITAEMVKAGAVVVDVGINVLPQGGVTGDVDYEQVREVAGAISPVPGGVGVLTNLMVLKQTIDGAAVNATA
jgi:methylenetetrahydrofolate dehydrogenase (NADP+)/methenyltetrahydrofolate cyclohydrolase